MSVRVVRVSAAVLVAAFALHGVALASTLTMSSKALTVYRTCALTAYPNTSTTDIDSYVDQNNKTTNLGTATTLSVQSLTTRNRRIYVKFDLTKCNPSVPSTAAVKLATLRLFVSGLSPACETLDIFPSTSSWTETGITWNNQPFGTSLNNPSQSSRTDSIIVGTAACANSTLNAYVSGWNVTADVVKFVAGTSTNNGWMIRDDVEGSAVVEANTFSSREAAVLAQAPQLIVTYTT